MTSTHYGICSLCEACCGVAIEHDGQRVVSIRGDREDPMSAGHVCPKVIALKDVHEDPDRLRRPIRREGSKWVEIGWPEAIEEACAGIVRVQREHGRSAVAFSYGNPTAHSLGALTMLLPFVKTLDTRNVFSANSLDALPRMLVSFLLYGNQSVMPVPDLDCTRYLLVFGANPVVSNGSVMTAPGMERRLRGIRERGGKVVVFDPRRTETAALADEHHFVRPGTDVFVLAAMIATLFEDDTVARKADELWSHAAEVRAAVEPFPPERVQECTGVQVWDIRRIAREFSEARAAVCYGRVGTCVQEHGTLTTWLIDVLNALTGNLDRPGGAMFARSATDLPAWAPLLGQAGAFGRWKTRVRGLPEFGGESPLACFAEECETPGPARIRGLVTLASNPVLSAPNGRRIDRALESLDFMVCVDIYLNETTRHANLILPPLFALERDYHPLLFHALSVRNGARFAPALFPRPAGSMGDWQILAELSAGIGRARGPLAGALGALQRNVLLRLGPRGILDLLLRLGPYRLSVAKLLEHPHGLDLGPLEPRLKGLLRRGNRPVNLAPELLVRELVRVEREFSQPGAAPDGTLSLIGRRERRSNNSWLHNCERLVRGPERCTLWMHPRDAAARGLADASLVRVSSRVGSVETRLVLTEDVMPGVVSLPHGWGHNRKGVRLRVATVRPGVSFNDLADDARTDAISGVAVLNGIAVEVERAERSEPEARSDG